MTPPDEALRQAVRLHQAGDLESAERLYRDVIAADPRNADAHHLLGMIALAQGNARRAVELIQAAIDCHGTAPEFHAHLGAALLAAGDANSAVDAFRRRLAIEPAPSAAAHHELAGALRAARRLSDAEMEYRRALVLDPALVEAHNDLGNTLHELRRSQEALASFQQAARRRPDLAAVQFNLGNCLCALQRLDEAAEAYRQATTIDPNFAAAWKKLAAVLIERRAFDQAAECARRAAELDPRDAEAHVTLGVARQSLGQSDEAEACYDRALGLDPANVTAHFNRGALLQAERRLAEAEPAFAACVRLLPDSAEMRLHLGKSLQVQGKFGEAIEQYDRAIALDPTFKHAHFFRGMSLLTLGDFAAGWQEYEWRLQDSGRSFDVPTWNGEPLGGRRILVHAEWGFGDTLMFVRYARLVEERGGEVVLEVQPPLVPLVRQSGFERVVAAGDPAPKCDLHVPLLSLPRIFGTTFESIPANVPYLRAAEELRQAWSERLRSLPGFRIGIQWLGSPIAAGEARRIPLDAFAPVARVPGVTLVNLQKHQGADEVAALGERFSLVHFDDAVSDAHRPFEVTAAIVSSLDLVITCDTSIAHLAGGLGAPVWVALPMAADWRWFRERDDSPWYPTMRLFRQRRQDDWYELFERVAASLGEHLAASKQ